MKTSEHNDTSKATTFKVTLDIWGEEYDFEYERETTFGQLAQYLKQSLRLQIENYQFFLIFEGNDANPAFEDDIISEKIAHNRIRIALVPRTVHG